MIKVFLVEDEIIMREGIRQTIEWEKEGFEFVGEASDGELAYPLIQKLKPDILITDIRMPFMDGLELSRLVKQELPEIKIIILSGYDEFEYAKEGITIGITDYILKPIAGAKLLEAVKKVGQLVLEEREFKKTFELEHQENIQIARQKFFRELVFGKKSASLLLEEGRRIGMELGANRYNILLFQIFIGEMVQGYSEEENAIIHDMENMIGHMQGVLMVGLGIEGWAFIFKETTEKPLETVQKEFLTQLRNLMDQYKGIEYFGGVGQAVERLSELDQCFEEAGRAFSYRYLKRRNQIIKSSELSEQPYKEKESEFTSLEFNKLDRHIVERFLKTGSKGEICRFLDRYFLSFGERNIRSLMFCQYVVMDVHFVAVALLKELGYKEEQLAEIFEDIQSMDTVFGSSESSKKYLKKILEITIDMRDAVSQKKYHSLLEEAKSYIKQHFDDEAISLNSVAASVNMSPNHFSSIFSQETGQTFIEYLTFVRMERAKELLCTSSMKTAEIAYAVGYKDAHYFSYLFKKTQDCTPREFRQRN